MAELERTSAFTEVHIRILDLLRTLVALFAIRSSTKVIRLLVHQLAILRVALLKRHRKGIGDLDHHVDVGLLLCCLAARRRKLSHQVSIILTWPKNDANDADYHTY